MILGIDIGTQSLKASLVDASSLRVLAGASESYAAAHPRPGWAQQDSDDWERALPRAIAAALSRADRASSEVRAIGISGQLDGCIAVDADGEPFGPCLIWMDRRAGSAMPALDSARFAQQTGQVADPSHMAAKIRWLMRNAVGLDAARFHQPVSFMVERLTGEFVIDHALASTTMVYSLESRDWADDLLSAFEISRQRLPRIASASDLAGRLTERGAELTGLVAGTPVAVGTGDDFAAPLGAGLVGPGAVACGVGTAEVVGALSATRVFDPGGLVEVHGYVNDCYFVENPGWLSGGAMAWLCGLMGVDFATMDELAGRVPAGSDGVTFLPALTGAMAPEWIPSARGCFYGLAPSHGRGHFARAVMEGCAFAMRDVVDRLDSLGVATDEIWLMGGGARSALWAQIRADVAGRSVRVVHEPDTCPLGAAVLAAVAAGLQPDLDTCAALLPIRDRTSVQPAHSEPINQAYARYRALFEALRPLF